MVEQHPVPPMCQSQPGEVECKGRIMRGGVQNIKGWFINGGLTSLQRAGPMPMSMYP